MASASVTSAALMMLGMERYDAALAAGPMQTTSSASSRYEAPSSALL